MIAKIAKLLHPDKSEAWIGGYAEAIRWSIGTAIMGAVAFFGTLWLFWVFS